MMRPAVRLVAALTLPLIALLGGRLGAQAASHRAALLIEHSNGSLIARCIAFAEEAISGLQLIERSGIQSRTQPFGDVGVAVCQLDFEPAQAPENCFGSGPYWQYYRHAASGWRLSATGASGTPVHDGDLDGWHYAAGPQAPPPVSFAQVCGAPASATSPVAAAPVATAPERPDLALTAMTPAATEAGDPTLARVPLRRLAQLPDTAALRTRTSSPPAGGAAPAVFGASLGLLGLLLLFNWRRRLS